MSCMAARRGQSTIVSQVHAHAALRRLKEHIHPRHEEGTTRTLNWRSNPTPRSRTRSLRDKHSFGAQNSCIYVYIMPKGQRHCITGARHSGRKRLWRFMRGQCPAFETRSRAIRDTNNSPSFDVFFSSRRSALYQPCGARIDFMY